MPWRRLPLSSVAVATVVAVAAAVGVYAVLGGAGEGGSGRTSATSPAEDGGGGPSSSDTLVPTGELPASLGEVRLAALDGGRDRTLGELLGSRPVVLNVFASWCVPCLDEMPAVEAVHQSLGDRVSFLGLANRDSPELALEMVERTGVTYPAFGDPESSAATYFGVTAMPATVFIDATGAVVEVASEAFTEDQLRQRIAGHFGVAA